MLKSLKNQSKTLSALAILAGMASSPLLAPPKKTADTDKETVDTAAAIAAKNIELEAKIAQMMAATEKNLGVAPEAPVAQVQPAQEQNNDNPFAKVDYFTDGEIQVELMFGSVLVTITCGQGGTGSALVPLEEIKLSKEYIKPVDLGQRLGRKKGTKPFNWSKGFSLFFPDEKTRESVADFIELVNFFARNDKQKCLTLPAGCNLALRTMILLSQQLPFSEKVSQIATLAARYKLSLQQTKAGNQDQKSLGERLFKRLIKAFRNDDSADKDPKKKAEEKDAKKKDEPKNELEQLIDFISQDSHDLALTADDKKRLGYRPGYIKNPPAPEIKPAPGVRSFPKPAVARDVNVITDAGRNFLDKEVKEKKLTTQDRSNLETRVRAGKQTEKDKQYFEYIKEREPELFDQGFVAGKLIARAMLNAHTKLAKAHNQAMDRHEYSEAFRKKQNSERNRCAFISSTFGIAKMHEYKAKIDEIEKQIPTPTVNATNEGILAAIAAQRAELVNFYHAEKTALEALDLNSDECKMHRYLHRKLNKLVETMSADNASIDALIEAVRNHPKNPTATETRDLNKKFDDVADTIDNTLPLPVKASTLNVLSFMTELENTSLSPSLKIKSEYLTEINESMRFTGGFNKEQADFIEEGLRCYAPWMYPAE